MKIESAGGTHVGKIRYKNEDNFYINKFYKKDIGEQVCSIANERELPYYTFAVCDGMGGENFGEIASLKALEVLKQYDNGNLCNEITSYIDDANKVICQEMIEKEGKRIGSTVSLLTINQNRATICNLGDSRIYRYKEGILQQLSSDHTRAQQLVDAGVIDHIQARNHKMKHTLTQHLGVFPHEFQLDPYIKSDIPLQHGDIFLLCSDGVTDMLTDQEIEDIIAICAAQSAKYITNTILEKTLELGAKDNVTLIIIKVL